MFCVIIMSRSILEGYEEFLPIRPQKGLHLHQKVQLHALSPEECSLLGHPYAHQDVTRFEARGVQSEFPSKAQIAFAQGKYYCETCQHYVEKHGRQNDV